MTARNVLAALALTALLSGGAVFGAGASATADTTERPALLLSNDGATWAGTLPKPVFSPEQRHVPGDTTNGTFWVRNVSGHDAWLTVQLSHLDAPRVLAQNLTVVVASAGRSSGEAQSLSDCASVVRDLPIASGQTLTLDASVALAASAPPETRKLSASFDFSTTLHDAPLNVRPGQCLTSDGTPFRAGQRPSPDAADLARTGLTIGAMGAVAAALIIFGLIASRRRKERNV